MTAKNGTRLLKPAIGLKRPDRGDKGKHDKKLNVVLTLVKQIALPMRSRWHNLGTEWLLFKKKLTRCITRQNITSGPTKYALARRLLSGRALADFHHAATANGNKSPPNYKR